MSNLQRGAPERQQQPSWLARCFFVAFLAVQVVLPARDLLVHGAFFTRKAKADFPFTWRMYSNLRSEPRLVAIYAKGKKKRLTPEQRVGRFAAHVRYGDYLPRLLCETNHKIVRIERKTRHKRETFAC